MAGKSVPCIRKKDENNRKEEKRCLGDKVLFKTSRSVSLLHICHANTGPRLSCHPRPHCTTPFTPTLHHDPNTSDTQRPSRLHYIMHLTPTLHHVPHAHTVPFTSTLHTPRMLHALHAHTAPSSCLVVPPRPWGGKIKSGMQYSHNRNRGNDFPWCLSAYLLP